MRTKNKMEQETKTEIKQLSTRVMQVQKTASLQRITTKSDVEEAQGQLETIKKGKGYVKTWKEKWIDPVKAHLKNLQEEIKPVEEALSMAESNLKTKIVDYQQRELQKAEEKKKEIAAKVESGEISFEKAVQKVEKVEEKPQAFKTRTIKEVEVVNEDLIPKDYWVVDMVKVRKDALAGVAIPGVKVTSKEIAVN
ncbi:MAG: hypothetical protein U1C72_00120 [Candidatus Pacearchaeota archaeon]|nr:hypothetical protein [Candidatus Pacearchaeota archaeon]